MERLIGQPGRAAPRACRPRGRPRRREPGCGPRSWNLANSITACPAHSTLVLRQPLSHLLNIRVNWASPDLEPHRPRRAVCHGRHAAGPARRLPARHRAGLAWPGRLHPRKRRALARNRCSAGALAFAARVVDRSPGSCRPVWRGAAGNPASSTPSLWRLRAGRGHAGGCRPVSRGTIAVMPQSANGGSRRLELREPAHNGGQAAQSFRRSPPIAQLAITRPMFGRQPQHPLKSPNRQGL